MAAQQKGEIEETELKVSSTLPAPPPPTSPPQQQQISVMSDLKLSDDRSTDLKTCVKDQSISPAQQQQQQQQVSVVSNVKFSDRTILISDLKSCKVDESSSSSVSSRKRQREEVSRCSGTGCRRKIGLMPFRCRCGEVFCPEHRYSDRHDCNYDYKSAGREAIAKENPVVKAAKIIKV